MRLRYSARSRLPNEILYAILDQLPAKNLARVAPVNRFFYVSVVKILYERLVEVLARSDSALRVRWEFTDVPLPPAHATILHGHLEGIIPLGGRDFGDCPRSFRDLRALYCSYQLAPRILYKRHPHGHEIPFRIDSGHLALDTIGDGLRMTLAPSLIDVPSDTLVNFGKVDFLFPKHWFRSTIDQNGDDPGRILWLDDSNTLGIRYNVRRADLPSSDSESEPWDVLSPRYTIIFRELLFHCITNVNEINYLNLVLDSEN